MFFGQAQSNNELVTVMHVFDQRTFLRLQSVILTDVPGQVSRTVRCGANGLALLANNRVYLLNTNLLDVSASNLPAAPVSVSAASYQPVVADKAREICLSSWRKTPRQHRAPARFWWLAQHCRLCRPDAPQAVTAKIGGVDAEVLFSGAQGDFVGMDQINLRIPRNLGGRGLVMIELAVDGKQSTAVQISIK